MPGTVRRLGTASLVAAVLLGLAIPTAALGQNEQIFADGFESGDTSAWSKAKRPRRLEVNTDAALEGVFGLEVLAGGRPAWLLSKHPKREKDILISLLIQPHTVQIPEEFPVTLLQLIHRRKRVHVSLQLEQTAANRFKVNLYAGGDTGDPEFVGGGTIRRNRTSLVELVWQRALAPGAMTGGAALIVNGKLAAQDLSLDNDGLRIDRVRLGALIDPLAGTTGTYYLDDFQSFRTLAP